MFTHLRAEVALQGVGLDADVHPPEKTAWNIV
jgi:hypothetical protein